MSGGERDETEGGHEAPPAPAPEEAWHAGDALVPGSIRWDDVERRGEASSPDALGGNVVRWDAPVSDERPGGEPAEEPARDEPPGAELAGDEGRGAPPPGRGLPRREPAEAAAAGPEAVDPDVAGPVNQDRGEVRTPPPPPPPPGQRPPPPPAAPGAPAGDRPPPGGPITIRSSELTALAVRIATMEADVRRAADQVADLRAARLPETLEAARAETAVLRQELRQALEEVGARVARERREVTDQIAGTVEAANEWFVRTRDQLFDRLRRLAELHGGALDQPGPGILEPAPPTALGPTARITGAHQVGSEAAPSPEPGAAWPMLDPASQVADWGLAPPQLLPGAGALGSEAVPFPAKDATTEAEGGGAGEGAPGAEVGERLDELRRDLEGLSLEVSTIGEVILGMQGELGKLREGSVVLEEDQVLAIIDGVAAAVRAGGISGAGPSSRPPGARPPGSTGRAGSTGYAGSTGRAGSMGSAGSTGRSGSGARPVRGRPGRG